jgi:hypothetical protein
MCEKLSAILEADRSCFGIGAERQINMCNALEELRQGEVLSNFFYPVKRVICFFF